MSKKILFIVLGIIILGELVWAGWTLSRSNNATGPVTKLTFPVKASPTTISLTSEKSTIKTGDKTTVLINLSSTRSTDGTDLIILYDPKVLSVNAQNPVTFGKLYDDYPLNKVDLSSGKIMVSGISNKKGGTIANGLFGSVEFTAKAPGKTKIVLDFTPGSTVDSNVIETSTGHDILQGVNNLELNIN